jgi:two-component system response regulator FixJ
METKDDTLHDVMHPAGADPAEPPLEATDRQKVYIVDDDSMVRRSLHFSLGAAGFEVRAFRSGRDFLDEADALAAGCVLLDMRMPHMDGIAVLEELGERVAHLPVVMITGHGDVNTAVKAMKGGATDFLEKPFTDAALFEVLNTVFSALPARAVADAERTQAKAQVAKLTPRESELLQGLLTGLSNKGVANRLGISVRTVEMHRSNLMERVGARSLAEVVHLALLAGMKPL